MHSSSLAKQQVHDTSPALAGLRARLACGATEVEAAQQLRYRVFFEEMGAEACARVAALKRDIDRFDRVCDHLVVLDQNYRAGCSRVVGTYRLLRRSIAESVADFYSQDEYDLTPLLRYPGELLEMGRSCVDPEYRDRGVMQLLWQGIAAYIQRYRIGILFGCASLPGTQVHALRHELAYLHHRYLAPAHLRPRALAHRYAEMRRLAAAELDPATAWRALPPLIRGYLRVGGKVGDGAVIDPIFNTVDVCMVVETARMTGRYLRHYRPLRGHPAS